MGNVNELDRESEEKVMNVNGIMGMYQYATAAKTTTKTADVFATALKNAAGSAVDSYTDYLKGKYPALSIQSIPCDQKTLEKIGKGMSGNDVIIAPKIVEQMATDTEKAKYYEGKIDNFFENVIPQQSAWCAAQGLVFEPGGVVVHDDGTVTYICGCSDSPERKAQVEAEHKEKQEKEAALRKERYERSQEEADERHRLEEISYRRRNLEAVIYDSMLNAGSYIFSESLSGMISINATGASSFSIIDI